MSVRLWIIVAAALLAPVFAAAEDETLEKALQSVDLSAWQEAADETGAGLDVMEMVRELAQGQEGIPTEEIKETVRRILAGEASGMAERLISFIVPALLWALSRQMQGAGGLGESAGYVCYLAGACVMLDAFAEEARMTEAAIRRMGVLTEQVFPVLSALMSASGRAGAAGMTQALASFLGGGLMAVLEKTSRVLCAGAAALAVAGNLTERVPLRGMFSLCCRVGNWIFGAVMAAFLAMTALFGPVGAARDSVSVRAARYAADNLLPVVGGDVADTMDAMAGSLLLVKNAAGVTGAAVMLAVCVGPVVRLALAVLSYRLAAALTEPVSDGPLRRCAEQLGDAAQMLLVAVSVSAALFITLTGVTLSAG